MLESIFTFLGMEALLPFSGIGGLVAILLILNEVVFKKLSRPSHFCPTCGKWR